MRLTPSRHPRNDVAVHRHDVGGNVGLGHDLGASELLIEALPRQVEPSELTEVLESVEILSGDDDFGCDSNT